MGNKRYKIMTWNAQSIYKKKQEFFNFLINDDIDIALITETCLSNNLSLSHHLFKVYRLDRVDSRGGGVAILIRRTISHELLPCPGTKVIEAISIRVFLNNRNFVVTCAYFPGSQDLSVLRDFKEDILLLTNSTNFIIGGDLNARHSLWNCSRCNRAGDYLSHIMMNDVFLIHFPDSHTHFPHSGNSASTIDFFLSKGFPSLGEVYTNDTLYSDHVVVIGSFDALSRESQDEHFHVRDYSNANWPLFQTVISQKLHQINLNFDHLSLRPDLIDEYINKFVDIVHEAENCAIPFKRRSFSSFQLTREIRGLIGLRSAKLRLLRRNFDEILRNQINLLSNRIDHLIRNRINDSFSNSLSFIDQNPGEYHKKFWRLTKFFKSKPQNMPPLNRGNDVLLTDSEKAEALGTHFKGIHDATDSFLHRDVTSKSVKRSLLNIHRSQFDPNSIRLVSESEVISIISSLKKNKAPGFDGITNGLLKKLPPLALTFLIFMFNVCLLNDYFPKCWKISKVKCICKPCKPSRFVDSYRPISLLSCVSKIFERIILSRLNEHIIENNIIPDHQYGFRPGKSCTHQLFRLTNIIKNNLLSRKSTGILSFDLKAAFDSVWHQGLLHKLYVLGFPIYLIKMIQSFLSDRSLRVSIGKSLSDIFQISAGVPQGAVLSPILFNIFLYDIPCDSNTSMAQFADDTTVVASSHSTSAIVNRLQSASDKICRYFKRWRIRVNPEKSEAILFTRKTALRHIPQRCVSINNDDVIWKDSLKYLGVYLDPKLIFKIHIEYLLTKCDKLIKSLYPLIHRNSKISFANKLRLFKTVFRPVFSYAAPIWSTCAKCHLKRIQIFQNRVLKMMFDLDRFTPTVFVHSIADVDLIETYFEKLRLNFIRNCQFNMNRDINALV